MDDKIIDKVVYTCYNCAHFCSIQPDIICFMWCSETDRDFTFSDENTDICKLFEDDD